MPRASGQEAESKPPGAGPASPQTGWLNRIKTALTCPNPQSSSRGCSSVISASPLVLHLGAAITEAGLGPQDGARRGAGSGSQVPCLAAPGGQKEGWKSFFSLFLLSSFPVVLNTHLMSSDQSINLICSPCSAPAATFSLV